MEAHRRARSARPKGSAGKISLQALIFDFVGLDIYRRPPWSWCA